MCSSGRFGRASRFEFDGFTFPFRQSVTNLRLSVESSALFTLKNDEPAALPAFLIPCVISWPCPGGTSTSFCGVVEWVYDVCTCEQERNVHRSHSCIYLETRKIFCTSRVYINDLFPLLLWTLYNLSSRCKYKYVYALSCHGGVRV